MNFFKKKSFPFVMLVIFCSLPFFNIFAELAIDIINHPLNRQDKRKAEIAIASMFKDDAFFLLEWIEFHRLIGVSHFYLYNNCNQDNYEEILNEYITKGIVELFDVPFDSSNCNDNAKTHNAIQVFCYNHALKLAKGYNKWVAIIDSDEFICPVQTKNLKSFLKKYSYAAGLVIYCQTYGPSNVWELEKGKLLIESCLFREPNLGGNGMFKSIVNPNFATCIDPHCCTYLKNHFSVNQNHQRFSHTPNFQELPVDLIRINHYTYRTLSFYYQIKKPRREHWGFTPDLELEKQIIDTYNSVYDPVMLPFVDKLKKVLNR